MTTTLYAGAARRTINPVLGTGKGGLRLFGDPVQAIESDLTATTLVLAGGEERIAVVAVDLCVMSTGEATRLREAVARALDVRRAHVLLNLSHNHSAPALSGFMWMTDVPAEAALRERYYTQLEHALVESAVEAAGRLEPARIGTGQGRSRIGVYRREFDGDVDILGEVPEHPIDESVGVVRVDDLDGQPIATLFRYSAHPVTVGPRSVVASADYPGPARQVVEQTLGGLAIFLQGCGGNVNPAVGIGYEVDCADTKNRVGIQLGAEVTRVAAGIRTNRRPGPRTTLGSVPNILVTPWEWVSGSPCERLAAAESVVTLDLGELPSLEQAQAIHDGWANALEERLAGPAEDWEVRVARKYLNWSQGLVDAAARGSATCELPLQALRFNDVVLVGIGAEVFFETGLEIQERSGGAATLVLGYTNGVVSYLPRAEDLPPDGWRVDGSYALPDLLPQNWELPVAVRADAAARTVDAVLELVAQLSGGDPACNPAAAMA
jgi:neutral ceramidase